MTNIFRLIAIAPLVLATGCASIVSGTTQEITFNSNPPGANCDITRSGASLQKVTTPSSTIVQKTKYDLQVTCAKPGYVTTAVTDKSGLEPWVLGNIVFGGIIGIIVDASTGAQNKYDTPVLVQLPPAPLPPPGIVVIQPTS